MFNPNNPAFNQFGGFNNFQNGLSQFAQIFGQGNNGANLEQMAQQRIQEMLNSGKISQEQFEMARQKAMELTGMNR